MCRVGCLAAFLGGDDHDPRTVLQVRQIRADQIDRCGLVEVLEHMRAQQGVERSNRLRLCVKLLWRVRLVAVLPAHGDRSLVRVDADAARPDEVEATTDTTADVEHPTPGHSPNVPAVWVGDEVLPTLATEALQPPRVRGIGGAHGARTGGAE